MKILLTRLGYLLNKTSFSITYKSLGTNSNSVRQEFISFFIKNYDHIFLKSSPVVPFCDPSVPFVNAGMNQFKGVFLGQSKPPYKRIANSQKCIRVGGKHNDLEVVGSDGHHHTFFEMLGNWSFGDYFKEKACRMAWELLTGPYNFNQNQLYVTYFGGDEEMGLEADEETRNIWINIGIPPERVLAFGLRENFWEMGLSGPCGPCTEIHYDHEFNRKNASSRVNQGFDDVVEVWNLVFIQYNRGIDGSLNRLPTFHVDTGMGLERLVAILQGKRSNYDTDLFIPLFDSIQKISGAPAYTGGIGNVDTSYRILADHSRMITVALADGMFPDENFKLRRILRRALNVAEHTFGCQKGLMTELSNHVAETLVDAYPEVGAKLKQIQLIISHEEEIFKSLQKTVFPEWQTLVQNHEGLKELNVEMMPGIVAAFKELEKSLPSSSCGNIISPDLSFKLYDTFGLDRRTIGALCSHFGVRMNNEDFQNLLLDVRKQSREIHQFKGSESDCSAQLMKYAMEQKLPPTDDSFKYFYHKEKDYVFPPLESQILGILCDNECVPQASGVTCDLIFNRTNLYHEAGGQLGDTGFLILNNGTRITIKKVTNVQGYLLHKVEIPEKCTLSLGDHVTMEVDVEKRLGCMRNHTATHVVNAALHKMLTITCQKSSQVSESSLSLEFSVYGEDFGREQIKEVQELVQNVVSSAVPVKRETVNAQKLQEFYISNEVTLVPGEIYPEDGIHIIEIIDRSLESREACCGTHLLNTMDVGDFCITTLKSASAGTRALSAVTGRKASDAIVNGVHLLENVSHLKKYINSLMENESITSEEVSSVEQQLQNMKQDIVTCERHSLPYMVHVSCLEDVEELIKKLKHYERVFFRENLENEMRAVLKEIDQPFLVHYLKSTSDDEVPLQKATKMCPHLPVLLIASCGNSLKARCCVPKKLISENFNAKLWLEEVICIFKAKGFVPRGQNSEEVFNMKKKYVNEEIRSILINDALNSAKKFVERSIRKV